MTLDNTIARCVGSQCSRKLECARYIALADKLPEGGSISFGDNYCSVDTGHGELAWHWSYIIESERCVVGNS